ncbi:hypothetical protein DFH11DRAFT_1739563 [Phellopilus nigrolimitatus]|nr:hypothetical protein DFH11DRAFT_1739563 [Phellopilus nigrolimitatus]
MTPRTKKLKLQDGSVTEETEPSQRDLFSILPFELLDEILSRTSPKEVLALARCSRYFCNTLVNESAARIWKASRASCVPRLPDPTPNFTESAYAAYIFDGGSCENCKKHTDNYYKSFSLRLRLCDNNQCLADWKRENALHAGSEVDHIAVMQWLPCSEDAWGSSILRMMNSYYRKTQFCQALEEYKQVASRKDGQQLYYIIHHADEARKKEVMDLSGKLVNWVSQRNRIVTQVKQQNLHSARLVAEKEGWETSDLKNAPSCAALLRHKNRAIEAATNLDFKLIKPAVEIEIAKIIEKRKRAADEESYRKRREAVALDFHRLKSSGIEGYASVLPTLQVFREQLIIKALQTNRQKDPKDVTEKLKDPTVKSMIGDNLAAWREKARNDFSTILGFENYQAISDRKLHPVERLTARFLCTKCVCSTIKDHEVPSLDFKAACGHSCPHLNKKQRSKEKWSAGYFVPDSKAIKVTMDLFTQQNISVEERSSTGASSSFGDRIQCKSCDGIVVMNFEAMQRHSHRHEDMKVELLTQNQVQKLKRQPIEWGLRDELMSMAKSAPRKQNLRIYGCRHCIEHESPQEFDCPAANERPDDQGQSSSTEIPVTAKSSKKSSKKGKLMSFHGLRGHVSQSLFAIRLYSHGAAHISDEDLYRIKGETIAKAVAGKAVPLAQTSEK